MRRRSKILSGVALLCVSVVAIIAGQTGVVRGENPQAAPTDSPSLTTADIEPVHDPNTSYPLGSGAIGYEQLSPAAQASVDHVQEVTDTSQLPSSYQAWSIATASTGQQAEIEIAARLVGLVGTEADGVAP
jgi:hypothetical protein